MARTDRKIRRRIRNWTVEDIPAGALRVFSGPDAGATARRMAAHWPSFTRETVPLSHVTVDRAPVDRPSRDPGEHNREVRRNARAARRGRR